MTTIIFGILEEGLVYAIMALGVYITYKILDFPDLSVDGTFPLGGAVTAAGIANGFAALAGSVYCQQKGFFEISIGTGTMVIGLANVIIGTQLLKRVGFIRSTTAVIIGSIVYKACVSIALLLNDLHIAGLDLSIPVTASDLKLITSVLFLIILVVSPSGGKKVKSHA